MAHNDSFDKVLRPIYVQLVPKITHPLAQLDNHTFSTHTRFDKDGFERVMRQLTLMPTIIEDAGRQKHALELAVYIMLRRWHNASSWQDMSNSVGISRPELINCYTAIITAFEVYHGVISTLDYIQIRSVWFETF
jgi:hypothetical protein